MSLQPPDNGSVQTADVDTHTGSAAAAPHSDAAATWQEMRRSERVLWLLGAAWLTFTGVFLIIDAIIVTLAAPSQDENYFACTFVPGVLVTCTGLYLVYVVRREEDGDARVTWSHVLAALGCHRCASGDDGRVRRGKYQRI